MAEKHYILAADIGGSGTKSMLFDPEEGKVLHLAFRESKIYHDEGPDATTLIPEEIFESAYDGIKECVQATGVKKEEIAGIVVDGQQSGLMMVDEDFNALGPYDTWLDNRYAPYVKVMTDICGDRIRELGGTDTAIVHGPKILWWKDHKTDLFNRTCKFTIMGNYVTGRLAGLKGKDAFFENTSYGFSGIVDNDKNAWDEEICKAVGIPTEILPKIVDPTAIVGGLSKVYADDLGLLEGTPIVSGAGDFPAGTVACGVTKKGMIGDVAGTASIFYCCMDKWKADDMGTIRTLRSPIPGMWLPFNLFSGGGILRWYRDAFFAIEKTQVEDVYAWLEDEMQKMPAGTNGLTFYPYIGGSHTFPLYNGSWVGVKYSHDKKSFYHSILESIPLEYRVYRNAMTRLLGISDFSEARVIGGGAASDAFCQMKADVLGIPYKTLDEQECSLLGTGLIAANAVGLIDDLVNANERVNKIVKVFEPNPETQAKYDEIFNKWYELGYGDQKQFLFGI